MTYISEDVERFYNDTVAIVKSYGKLRGKSRDATELAIIVHRIIESNFPEASIFSNSTAAVSNKRGVAARDEAPEDVLEQKKGKLVVAGAGAGELTNEQKVILLIRQYLVVQNLMVSICRLH